MTSQTIIWTALPNGVIGSGLGQLLRIAVHIAPRLSTDDPSPTMGLFSDFQSAMQVWPEAMPSAFTDELGGATPITIPHIAPTVDPATSVPAADARLWRATVKDTTAVESYVYESLSSRNVVSYPLADVHDFLKSCYLGAATVSSTDLPTVPLLLEKTPFGKLVDPNVYNKGDNDFPFAKFTAVLDFFKPPSPGSPAPLVVPQFEFHQALSMLSKYPSLLALLGLVVELRIPVPASLQASVPASCTLRVAPEWSPHVSTTAITPRMHCYYTGDHFTADGGGSDVTGGMLRLTDPHFRLIQVDVDNAALKAISLGRTIGGAVDSQETAGLPSLRSVGFSLVRSQRAGKLGSQFASADHWNTN
ncbi:MAG TPA: hypothetical protein VFN11_22590, partial [Ktedonobacterales bacterium]|nr:hypothetical protein [Ktedonobacterales bacterium]